MNILSALKVEIVVNSFVLKQNILSESFDVLKIWKIFRYLDRGHYISNKKGEH
jgi:hypothetical protein